MPFLQLPLGLNPGDRELLGLWADLLGVLAFGLSVVGVAIAVVIERKVRWARREAARAIGLVVRLFLQRDAADARHSLELAREAIRSAAWGRAEGHLDAGLARLLRLLTHPRLPADVAPPLRGCGDGARELLIAVRGRRTPGAGALTRVQAGLLNTIIESLAVVEGGLGNNL